MIKPNKTIKKILDTLADACHVPIRDVCVISHNDKHFKAYVHGTSWYGQHVYDRIAATWGLDESNINITIAPKGCWPFGSTGYTIEVDFVD